MVIADTDAEAERLGLQAYSAWAGHIHHLTRKLGRPDVHKTEPFDDDSAQRADRRLAAHGAREAAGDAAP